MISELKVICKVTYNDSPFSLEAWSAPAAIMTGGMGFGGQVGKYMR